ncbi:hypothetical protein LSG31_13085 [Fodinisporobacter ferrooxydans]|uniref:Blue (type 1) copper domain-containing protein n=1 Tax=Fodinisporobacter ferrooxydans TaxID=2901836 RepID=A0ABY4CF14_9BACL|nr:hypothetical protein LSG31_13085 [Alicyclobacillaceae bacterium MYW30-H2]
MKKLLIAIPALVAGVVIGQFAVSQAFTPSNTQMSSVQNSTISNQNGFGMMGSGASGAGSGYSGMMGSGVSGTGSGYSGMMGSGVSGAGNGYSGGMGGMMGGWNTQVSQIPSTDVDKEVYASLQNAVIDKKANTITYKGNDVKIVLLAKMNDASNRKDDTFVVGGLINPAIHVQKGAKVSLELINEDNDMPHGLEITPASPPYPYMSMMAGGIYPGSFIHPIPESTNTQFATASTTFTADQSGEFHYLCEYPGHAQKGMYGTFVIG